MTIEHPPWPSPRVYGVVVRDEAVLLVRARSRRDDGTEVWWLPGGGVNYLESPLEALSREFREETGLDLAHASLLDVVSDTWTRRDGSTAHALRIIYAAEVDGHSLTSEGIGSTDAARWLPLAQLEDVVLAPYALAAVKLFAQTK
jgi:ADP-ribose pyrophosphatase YjhB (NUDIX family)